MGNVAQIERPAESAPFSIAIDYDELNAYNAAFHELGLRWHWDSSTWASLLHTSLDAKQRLRDYIGGHHPHLLKAYDADFLVAAIESKKRQFEAALAPVALAGSRRDYFDWAQSRAGEIGA